jgi:glycosyltransferase involved in cell wall biosynthesis
MASIVHLIPTLEGGGAERQLKILSAELQCRGIGVHIVCRRGGVFESALRDAGCKVHIIGDHKGASIILLGRIHAVISEIRPDIIQTWLPQMDVLGGIVALWNGIPWIIAERTSAEAFSALSIRALVRKLLAHFSSAIVPNSEGGERYWQEVLGCSSRINRIGNAVEVEAICGSRTVDVEASGVGTARVLIVGRLVQSKALDVVVQAIRLVPRYIQLQVTFIGEGPLRDELTERIKRSKVSDICTVSRFRSDWWQLLQGSSALISMSRYEGHPNVLLEAVIARCPVIASDIPAHREFLNEFSALLVPVNNPIALAEAIASLVTDQESADHRAEKAFDYVASKVNVGSMADAYVLLYEKLTEEVSR